MVLKSQMGGTFGWCGRILKVDFSDLFIQELETRGCAEYFLGGRGIAARLYWDLVPASTGAFDPRNHLIFMTGPIGATGAQGASRFIVTAKSPMTLPEGYCYGNMGGFFGPYLKRAGFDGIVVTGSSARFVTTGVAGENLCRTANIMTDNEGSSTGGFGAVMGSKNLKAIVVSGTGNPAVADPESLKKLNQLTIEGKARAAVTIIDRTCTKDSLLLCDSIWPLMVFWHTPDRVGDPSLESRIFTSVTGIETDEKELNIYGERIFNLERAIMIREGTRPLTDDDVAEFNYTQPVQPENQGTGGRIPLEIHDF
jgi:aldehyde:ferredoxin oxidoreductase